GVADILSRAYVAGRSEGEVAVPSRALATRQALRAGPGGALALESTTSIAVTVSRLRAARRFIDANPTRVCLAIHRWNMADRVNATLSRHCCQRWRPTDSGRFRGRS